MFLLEQGFVCRIRYLSLGEMTNCPHRNSSGMKDEAAIIQIMCESFFRCTHAPVVLFAVATAERRIKITNVLERITRDEHAEADACWNARSVVSALLSDGRSSQINVARMLGNAVVEHGIHAGIVGEGNDTANVPLFCNGFSEKREPILRHDRVAIQEHDVIRCCEFHPLICSLDEAEILFASHHAHEIGM